MSGNSDLLAQLLTRSCSILLVSLAMELYSIRGRRPVLFLGVTTAFILFGWYHLIEAVGSFALASVCVVAPAIIISAVAARLARVPSDIAIASTVVVQVVVWLWMIDKSNAFTKGELGFEAPTFLADLQSGWVPCATAILVTSVCFLLRNMFWKSDAGRDVQLFAKDRRFALSLGLQEYSATVKLIALSTTFLVGAVLVWGLNYRTYQATPFSIDFALLPVIVVIVGKFVDESEHQDNRVGSGIVVAVAGYFVIAFLGRQFFGSSGPLLDRLLIGLAILFFGIRNSR